ncbi:MAG: hypothetical protein JNM19_13650 [Chitinophagaceae bacterium]|nr:hypothetical protein [Chitinophagaceae bacterium]
MRKVFFCLSFILGTVFLVKAQTAEQMKWMAGTWKINAGSGVIVEQWQIINDSTLSGKSMFVKNGTDTIPQETIELAYRSGSWYYIPTVNSQNNALPVQFKVFFLKGTEFISENPSHDFPQRIAYRRIKNQLFASIEGRKNGKYGKQNFDFSSD